MSSERIVVHGPCLQDLTDFIYFDKITYPVVKPLIRPPELSFPDVGYPAQEPLSQEVLDKLTEADLLVAPGNLIFSSSIEDISKQIIGELDGSQPPQNEERYNTAHELGTMFTDSFATLELPASHNEVDLWLEDIDIKTKKFADFISAKNGKVVTKYYEKDITKVLQPGWEKVLSLTFFNFPCVTLDRAPLDDIITFFTDSETKKKRTDLFSWYKNIDLTAGDIKSQLIEEVNNIEALVVSYQTLLQESGLVSGNRRAEFLIKFADFLDFPLPEEHHKTFHLTYKGLSHTAEEMSSTGMEIAYISYVQRNWLDWFPGLIS